MAALNNVIRQLRRLVGGDVVKDDSDGQLVDRFVRTKDEQAFAALVDRHGGMVLGVCRRVLGNAADADDAFQATFLTLARKAGSIGKQGSVASWLYGVAYRVALKARTTAGRRRQHERQASAMSPTAADRTVAWNDLADLVDEEVNKLPERFRAPLVLCYLQGKSREQAADELGCSFDTVKGRLERARDALRDRLARRGLALSAAVLPTLLTDNACAGVSVQLSSSTINQAVSGSASTAPVGALVEGVVHDMFVRQTMKVAVLCVACAGLVCAGLMARAALSSERGNVMASTLFVPNLEPPQEVELPINKAMVHRLDEPRELGQAAVLSHVPQDPKELAARFAACWKTGEATVEAGEPMSLLCSIGMLNLPDKVRVRRLTRTGNELHLEIDYTNVVQDGVPLLQNIAYVALVEVPVELPARTYRLHVSWTKVAANIGTFKEVPATKQSFAFAVVDPKEGVLPINKAEIHKVLITRPEYKGLKEGVVVWADAPAGLPALAEQYTSLMAAELRKPPRFTANRKMALVTVGPELNSPDTVEVQRLTRHENRLVLDVRYDRFEGALLRNVPWRPLVSMPLALPAGNYELIVNWQAYSQSKKLPVAEPPLQVSTRFSIAGTGAKLEEVTDPARLAKAEAVLRVRYLKGGPLEKTGYDEVEVLHVLKGPEKALFLPVIKIYYSQLGEGGGVPGGQSTLYLDRLAKDGSGAWLLGNGSKQGASHITKE
ncbi:MAG: RNA polymerase sigma factor [Gemmataceae bacterium]